MQRWFYPVLHVVSEPGRQRACVQLIELNQLQQIVEFGRSLIESIQPAVATLIKDLKKKNNLDEETFCLYNIEYIRSAYDAFNAKYSRDIMKLCERP